MGFGALFLGLMFLYDFEIGLSSGVAPYAIVDLFPDLLGWILIFFGLRTLARKAEGFERLRLAPVFFAVVAALNLAKGTLWFSTFYSADGAQIFSGAAVDFAVHFLELAFLWLLFGKTAKLCRKMGDDKLSSSHSLVPRIALTEGVLCLVSKIPSIVTLPDGVKAVFMIVAKLDFLFWVFLIWFGVISMVRAMVRLSD